MRYLIALLLIVWMSGFATAKAFGGEVLVSEKEELYRIGQTKRHMSVLIKSTPMDDILLPEKEEPTWKQDVLIKQKVYKKGYPLSGIITRHVR